MVGAGRVTGEGTGDALAAALAENAGLRVENERLRGLLGLTDERLADPPVAWEPTLFSASQSNRCVVDRRSSPAEKIGMYRALFCGRDDVFALRWQNDRTGKSGWSPAVVGGWVNSKRPDRSYEPLTDAMIERHLAGEIAAGLYPLLRNDRCRLLACDFDGGSWALDALAYLDACRAAGLPAVLERSRSGDGGHVWIFFSGPVAAADARKVGAAMLRRAMASRAEIDCRPPAGWDRPLRQCDGTGLGWVSVGVGTMGADGLGVKGGSLASPVGLAVDDEFVGVGVEPVDG